MMTQTTFECYSSNNMTKPFTISTDIKMIDKSCVEDRSSLLSKISRFQ